MTERLLGNAWVFERLWSLFPKYGWPRSGPRAECTGTTPENKDNMEEGGSDFTTLRGSRKGDLKLTKCSIDNWK